MSKNAEFCEQCKLRMGQVRVIRKGREEYPVYKCRSCGQEMTMGVKI